MKVKALITFTLLILFGLSSSFAANLDLRFANLQTPSCGSSSGTFCVTVQIQSQSGNAVIGNGTIFITYNADAINTPVETPLNFSTSIGTGFAFDPSMFFLETAGAGPSGSTLGELNYAIVAGAAAVSTTPVVDDQSWTDVAQICWTVADASQAPDLAFVLQNPLNPSQNYTGFNDDNNVRANQHGIGNASLYTGPTCGVAVNLKVFLEGGYTSGAMNTNLQNNSLSSGFTQPILPLQQPYNNPPWNYGPDATDMAKGTEAIFNASLLSPMAVDWVLVEASTAGTLSSVVETRAGILLNDGNIVSHNGGPLQFYNLSNAVHYFIVRHRNHLAIITNTPFNPMGTTTTYDFTTGADEFYSGFIQMKDIGGGVYVMRAADINSNGTIDFNDRNIWATPFSPMNPDGNGAFAEYLFTDCNMDGNTDFLDFNLWRQPTNNGQTAPIDIFFP